MSFHTSQRPGSGTGEPAHHHDMHLATAASAIRMRSDSNATSIYVISGDHQHQHPNSGGAAAISSTPIATMERRRQQQQMHPHQQSHQFESQTHQKPHQQLHQSHQQPHQLHQQSHQSHQIDRQSHQLDRQPHQLHQQSHQLDRQSIQLDRQPHQLHLPHQPHPNRMSWVNMRQLEDDDDDDDGGGSDLVRTTTLIGGGTSGGTISGRTTATSGRMSSSGVNTISGSSNTLNDCISDYQGSERHTSGVAVNGVAGGGGGGAGVGARGDASSAVASPLTPVKNLSCNGSFNLANGSTAKLLPVTDDESNQQTKCSVLRGLVLCICLNVTYANVVRFPRELDKYGSAYLIPYVLLLFLVGLPVTLLEISLGQFLGQGAAHTWRSSPIFKGACIVSRFASWLSTIWVSLQAVLSVAYIGKFLFGSFPFRECGNIKMAMNGYLVAGNSGQECLPKTFLTPFWDNPYYFGQLSIGLICIWIVVMVCTHNGRNMRVSLFVLGLGGFALLAGLTGWEVHNSLARSYFPELWPFDSDQLTQSNIWFNALMQVLFAVNGGFGALPVITGKFLYKGDAVRTTAVYLCFNMLVNAIAVTLFLVQFDHSANGAGLMEELKPLTAIYDRFLYDRPATELLTSLMPSLIHVLMLIAALVSIIVAVYTATRLVPRHPNYVICLMALVAAIISLSAPKFIIARILDSRVVGTIIVTALIFELIAVTWIYGAKNIYTDLEFSIGRPIFKGWIGMWCLCPAILTGLLVWWCSDDDSEDLLFEYMPRWAPILLALAVNFLIACVQIFRQVEYNFFGMICEASKSAKEWGPADPLARHAWKQWRSVCQDTGRRDFTLRRRGTRDYTHSIKKGQYSTAAGNQKYAAGNGAGVAASAAALEHQTWKSSSTTGNSSPNYSGSMFGDSAIEEDISVDKFPGVPPQFVPFHSAGTATSGVAGSNDAASKQLRYSANRGRGSYPAPSPQQQLASYRLSQSQLAQPQQAKRSSSGEYPPPPATVNTIGGDKHREIVYIRRLSADGGQHATRIEINESNESITYGGGATRNPLAKTGVVKRSQSTAIHGERKRLPAPQRRDELIGQRVAPMSSASAEHICWQKFAVNPEEFSTEL